jgi:alpha-L-rhamnosidase
MPDLLRGFEHEIIIAITRLLTILLVFGATLSAQLKDGTFELMVEVPANTRATVRLPKAQLAGVTEGGQPLAGAVGITGPKQDGDAVVVEIGSGAYRFAYPSRD